MKYPKTFFAWSSLLYGVGYSVSAVRQNWGLALFLTATLPLVMGIHRLFQTPRPDRFNTWLLILVGGLVVYAFSPGPFVACGQLWYQLTGSEGYWNTAWRLLYFPHIQLMAGRFGSEPFNSGFTDYLIQWQILFSFR